MAVVTTAVAIFDNHDYVDVEDECRHLDHADVDDDDSGSRSGERE